MAWAPIAPTLRAKGRRLGTLESPGKLFCEFRASERVRA